MFIQSQIQVIKHILIFIYKMKMDYWIDYKFQTSWLYEMAWNYPFLYEKKFLHKFANLFIESTLLSVIFYTSQEVGLKVIFGKQINFLIQKVR